MDSELETNRKVFMDMFPEIQEILDENLVVEFFNKGAWKGIVEEPFDYCLVWHTDYGDTVDSLHLDSASVLLTGPIEKLPLVFGQLMPLAEAIATIRLKRGY